MNGKHFVAGLLLAVGMVATGCGGTEVEETVSETELSSREDSIIYPCDGTQMWTYTYYSNSSKTTQVGDWRCDCDGTTRSWGTKTSYYTFTKVACYNP